MRSLDAKMLVAATAGAVAAVLPLGLASPAHASTTRNGCTVTPLKPLVDRHLHQATGKKKIHYKYTIKCNGNYTLKVRQRLMEQDNGKIGDFGWQDDQIRVSNPEYKVKPGTTTKDYAWTLMDTDNDQTMEVFHKVSFQVCSSASNTFCAGNGKTPEENSPVLKVHL